VMLAWRVHMSQLYKNKRKVWSLAMDASRLLPN
jgi:hypothetical protein